MSLRTFGLVLLLCFSAVILAQREGPVDTAKELGRLIDVVVGMAGERGWDIERHAVHWVIAYTPAGANWDSRSLDAMIALMVELRKTKWWFADQKAKDRLSVVPYQLYVREAHVLGEIGGGTEIQAPKYRDEALSTVRYPEQENSFQGGHDMEQAAVWCLERLRGSNDWVFLVMSNTPSSNTPINDPHFPLVGDRSDRYLDALREAGITGPERVRTMHLFEQRGDEKHYLVTVDVYMPDEPVSAGFAKMREAPSPIPTPAKPEVGPIRPIVAAILIGGIIVALIVWYLWPVNVSVADQGYVRLVPLFWPLLTVFGPKTEPTLAPNVVLPDKPEFSGLSGSRLFDIRASGFRRLTVQGYAFDVIDVGGETPKLHRGTNELQLRRKGSGREVPIQVDVS